MAAHLGMSVRRAQEEIDSREFAYWMAFDELDPIGSIRGDLSAGIVAATVANANRSKDTTAFAPADFMPDFTPRKAVDRGQVAADVDAVFGQLIASQDQGG